MDKDALQENSYDYEKSFIELGQEAKRKKGKEKATSLQYIISFIKNTVTLSMRSNHSNKSSRAEKTPFSIISCQMLVLQKTHTERVGWEGPCRVTAHLPCVSVRCVRTCAHPCLHGGWCVRVL